MKLVHWPLMGGLLHLVQRAGAWEGPPVLLYNGPLLRSFNVSIKRLKNSVVLMLCIAMQVKRITGNVFNLLVMVNCAANFILYSALSTKFRATFSRLFCACRTSSPDASPRFCCCSWPVRTYSSAAGRDVNPGTGVAGRYASLQAGGRASAPDGGGRGSGHGAGRFASSSTFTVTDDVRELDEGQCSVTQTTTNDKMAMSSQSGIEEDLDDLQISSL